MTGVLTRGRILAAAAAITSAALAGCTGDDVRQATSSGSGSGGGSDGVASARPAETAQATAPFGPGCGAIPASGPGSIAEMANQPVATAASRNPALSTLVTAVNKAGLAGALNSAPAITVFAPTNDAFAKIPKATLDGVLSDKKTLTNILTYHVVGERRSPADLDSGSVRTLQGGTLTTAKNGETSSVNDAQVVCGNVQTRNATVYLIDTVLMPAK
jgi:uncharacterized surface protein with fasciclin (FAS1) repeats